MPGDEQTGALDSPGSEQQQPQIAAVTNGGVSIVPNSINDGPLVHVGTYPLTRLRPYGHSSRSQGTFIAVARYRTFRKMVRLFLQVWFRGRMPERRRSRDLLAVSPAQPLYLLRTHCY